MTCLIAVAISGTAGCGEQAPVAAPPAAEAVESSLMPEATVSDDNGTAYALLKGQSPTALRVTNSSDHEVYANLVLGLPPASAPSGCSDLGVQIVSVAEPHLRFESSVKGKTVAFAGPEGVNDKGAYLMAPGETITYRPQTFSCFENQTCTPALTANFFFTEGFNGTVTGNNGCGGAGSRYPNATNLAEASLNFSANGAKGASCPNADDTDISAVNGVNAKLAIDTGDAGTGLPWPVATRTAENGEMGTNTNRPGVFGWAATNCVNPMGYPNPTTGCAAPVDAPLAGRDLCDHPNTAIAYGSRVYCAETSQQQTCNNQRPAFTTGGTVKITYKGQIAPKNSR